VTDVRLAEAGDLEYLARHERIALEELDAVLRRGRILVAEDREEPHIVGWLRWGLLWDEVPFMNLLHVAEGRRRMGVGRHLVGRWESLCGDAGHAMVLTSTQSDESAQHFYRRLGYADAGGLLLPGEPLELLFVKRLA
jgi:GNAT superfamily N-acetyltransferase